MAFDGEFHGEIANLFDERRLQFLVCDSRAILENKFRLPCKEEDFPRHESAEDADRGSLRFRETLDNAPCVLDVVVELDQASLV